MSYLWSWMSCTGALQIWLQNELTFFERDFVENGDLQCLQCCELLSDSVYLFLTHSVLLLSYICRILQQQNEDLRRRLSQTTHKMEAMETEFETSRHYMQAELGRTRDDLEKMRDKFRRLVETHKTNITTCAGQRWIWFWTASVFSP